MPAPDPAWGHPEWTDYFPTDLAMSVKLCGQLRYVGSTGSHLEIDGQLRVANERLQQVGTASEPLKLID
jgi:hypothetical protein